MPFEKGKSGNPVGRPKGAKNKYSNDVLNEMMSFLSDNQEEFFYRLAKLDDKEYVRTYVSIFKDIHKKQSLPDYSNLPPHMKPFSEWTREEGDEIMSQVLGIPIDQLEEYYQSTIPTAEEEIARINAIQDKELAARNNKAL